LAQLGSPLEGHVLDLSETGMAVEVDSLIPVGQAVTVEFRVAGLGRMIDQQWTEFVAAAVVVRHDELEDFPQGPYKIALRFARIGTMAQAQIARFVATNPS
jgi:c-di-GMP-binding flagellar brake protein YcgR